MMLGCESGCVVRFPSKWRIQRNHLTPARTQMSENSTKTGLVRRSHANTQFNKFPISQWDLSTLKG